MRLRGLGLSWTYDAWGNRTDQTATGGTCDTFHQSVDNSNRLTGPPYQYDAAGNMTYDGSHTYFYDGENRLIQVDGTLGNCSTASACYVYDAFGRRVKKTAGSYSAEYIYNTAGQLDTVFGNTHFEREYVYLGARPIAEYAENNTYFLHGDHLGSTRLLTRYPDAFVRECDDYYPFGEPITCGDTTGSTLKFTGQERDTETSLDHFPARYGSSFLGRFMTSDPAGLAAVNPMDPQTWNRYAYVRNSPLSGTDPTGLRGPMCLARIRKQDQIGCDYGSIDENAGGDFSGNTFDLEAEMSMGGAAAEGAIIDLALTPTGYYIQPQTPSPSCLIDGDCGFQPFTTGPIYGNLDLLALLGTGNDGQSGGGSSPQSPTPQQKNQQCLNQINNTPDGKFYNFFSPLSMIPGIGPDWKGSIAEDVGGSAAKFAVFKFFQGVSRSMPVNPFGSFSGAVADTIEAAAEGVAVPLMGAATVGQVTVHAGCYVSSHF